MELLILLYFLVNSFAAGYNFKEEWYSNETIKYKFKLIFETLQIIFFFIPVVIIIGFWILVIVKFFNWLNAHFCIYFPFQFYFTKIWSNLPKENLEKLNELYNKSIEKKTIKTKPFRKAVEMINKRNNYDPKNG